VFGANQFGAPYFAEGFAVTAIKGFGYPSTEAATTVTMGTEESTGAAIEQAVTQTTVSTL